MLLSLFFFFSEGGEGQRHRPAIGQLFIFRGGGGQVRRGKSVILPLVIGFWQGSANRIFFSKRVGSDVIRLLDGLVLSLA